MHEHTFWLDEPDLRERMPGDLKVVILGLPAKLVELEFLPVYPPVERLHGHFRGFTVKLRVRKAIQ
ncbi:MAG: hypothetical protein KME19_00715 [Microcoleus vaginatus WJT46-NPBG5]|jgi:hypothetical protein|nr:hypothetical protein [Microcoleus vaginatus WJT46-NPBG5]